MEKKGVAVQQRTLYLRAVYQGQVLIRRSSSIWPAELIRQDLRVGLIDGPLGPESTPPTLAAVVCFRYLQNNNEGEYITFKYYAGIPECKEKKTGFQEETSSRKESAFRFFT